MIRSACSATCRIMLRPGRRCLPAAQPLAQAARTCSRSAVPPRCSSSSSCSAFLSLRSECSNPRSQLEVRILFSSSPSLFPQRPPRLLLVAAPALVLMLCGCKQEVAKEAPPPRPVRTVVVEKGGLSQSIVLTGHIQAEKEVALAFRIGGRIIERSVD